MLPPDLFATAFEPLDLNIKPLAGALQIEWRPFSAAAKSLTTGLSCARAPSNPISHEQRPVVERVSVYRAQGLLEPSMGLKRGLTVEAQTRAEAIGTRMGVHSKAPG